MKKICAVILLSVMAVMLFCSCGQGGKIQEIIMSNNDVEMTVGDSTTLSYVIKPSNASEKGLTWSSSNESVATVEDGKVKGISEGSATITVMTPEGVKAMCGVTVDKVKITSVVLSAQSSSIKVGQTTQIEAKVTPASADDNLEWNSSNADIASVDNNGIVTGISEGITVISCTASNGKSATCTITVKSSSSNSNSSSKPKTKTVYVYRYYTDSQYSNDYIIPDSNTRYLTDSELSGISSKTAQMAINEIYARHGRHFNNAEVRAYFESKSWYSENPYYSDSMLSNIENANIKKLTYYR